MSTPRTPPDKTRDQEKVEKNEDINVSRYDVREPNSRQEKEENKMHLYLPEDNKYRKMMTTGTLRKKNTGTNNSIELSSQGHTSQIQSVRSTVVENQLLIKVQNYEDEQNQRSGLSGKKASIKISSLINKAAGEEILENRKSQEPPLTKHESRPRSQNRTPSHPSVRGSELREVRELVPKYDNAF